jgi:uncharacterized protein with GYD domain
MGTYVILSRFSPEAFKEPSEFKKLADTVSAKIKKECKGTIWKYSFATLGRFDVVDVVEAEDPQEVQRAAIIIRSYNRDAVGDALERLLVESIARAEGLLAA